MSRLARQPAASNRLTYGKQVNFICPQSLPETLLNAKTYVNMSSVCVLLSCDLCTHRMCTLQFLPPSDLMCNMFCHYFLKEVLSVVSSVVAGARM